MFRYLGWRNLVFLPALLVIALIVAGVFVPGLYLALLNGLIIKAIVIAVALPVAQIAWAVRAGAAARKEPFCIHCGQCLTGLPPIHICPECGRPYDLAVLNDYRRDPAWFIQRWRARRDIPRPGPFVTVPPRAGPRKKTRDGT
jgi:hypothetical protein